MHHLLILQHASFSTICMQFQITKAHTNTHFVWVISPTSLCSFCKNWMLRFEDVNEHSHTLLHILSSGVVLINIKQQSSPLFFFPILHNTPRAHCWSHCAGIRHMPTCNTHHSTPLLVTTNLSSLCVFCLCVLVLRHMVFISFALWSSFSHVLFFLPLWFFPSFFLSYFSHFPSLSTKGRYTVSSPTFQPLHSPTSYWTCIVDDSISITFKNKNHYNWK